MRSSVKYQIRCGTLEPVAVEQGQASSDIVEVAIASAGVNEFKEGKN